MCQLVCQCSTSGAVRSGAPRSPRACELRARTTLGWSGPASARLLIAGVLWFGSRRGSLFTGPLTWRNARRGRRRRSSSAWGGRQWAHRRSTRVSPAARPSDATPRARGIAGPRGDLARAVPDLRERCRHVRAVVGVRVSGEVDGIRCRWPRIAVACRPFEELLDLLQGEHHQQQHDRQDERRHGRALLATVRLTTSLSARTDVVGATCTVTEPPLRPGPTGPGRRGFERC